MFVIPVYEGLRQEELHKFEVTLGSKFQAIQNYTGRLYPKGKKEERKKKERKITLLKHKFVNTTEKTLSKTKLPGMVAYTFNPSTQEGRSRQISLNSRKSGLQSKFQVSQS